MAAAFSSSDDEDRFGAILVGDRASMRRFYEAKIDPSEVSDCDAQSLLAIWKELYADYSIALRRFNALKESNEDTDFSRWCRGRLDVLYLWSWMQAKPELEDYIERVPDFLEEQGRSEVDLGSASSSGEDSSDTEVGEQGGEGRGAAAAAGRQGGASLTGVLGGRVASGKKVNGGPEWQTLTDILSVVKTLVSSSSRPRKGKFQQELQEQKAKLEVAKKKAKLESMEREKESALWGAMGEITKQLVDSSKLLSSLKASGADEVLIRDIEDDMKLYVQKKKKLKLELQQFRADDVEDTAGRAGGEGDVDQGSGREGQRATESEEDEEDRKSV